MKISKNRLILVSDDVSGVFEDAPPIDGDYSLHALVRALTLKFGEGELSELTKNCSVSKTRVRSKVDMQAAINSISRNVAVQIVECTGCFDEEIGDFEGWETEFQVGGKTFPVNQYLSQFGRTKLYVNPSLRKIVAFVDRRASHVWVQALNSVLCRLMTWYFPSDIPEDERTFFKSISVDNKSISPAEATEVFIKYVNEVANGYDFRSIRLHKMLDGVADKTRVRRMETLRREINSERTYIKDTTRVLGDRYRALDDKILELSGLELAPENKDDSMYRFFNQHKQVKLLEVEDSFLKFGVDDTLEFYDEDMFERMYNRKTSYIHECDGDVVKVLKNIFLDHKGLIRVNAVFFLEEFKLIEPVESAYCVDEAMPNPHIYFFGCSGGNSQYYSEYAESGDWDLAIEQAISATKNLNWGDSTVCGRMIRWMNDNRDLPFIYYKNNERIDRVDDSCRLISFNDFLNNINKAEEEANG